MRVQYEFGFNKISHIKAKTCRFQMQFNDFDQFLTK